MEDPDEQRGESGEDDDPVRVDEPVAEVDELAREEAVLREHGREPRKPLVRGLPPTHTFRLAESENWVALAVYLLTAISVSGLAARARRRAAEAEQRQRETSLAAEVSTMLLEHREVEQQLDGIADRVARVLGSTVVTSSSGSPRTSTVVRVTSSSSETATWAG